MAKDQRRRRPLFSCEAHRDGDGHGGSALRLLLCVIGGASGNACAKKKINELSSVASAFCLFVLPEATNQALLLLVVVLWPSQPNLKPRRLRPRGRPTHRVVVVGLAVGRRVRLPVRCACRWRRRRRRRGWGRSRSTGCVTNAVGLGHRALQKTAASGAKVLGGALRRHVDLNDVTWLRLEGNLIRDRERMKGKLDP